MRVLATATLVSMLIGGPALAANDCAGQLDTLGKEWGAIAFPTPAKPNAAIAYGNGGHVHTGGQVTYMTNQIRLAAHLCKDGNEHEAMLRMDVVRAWLKLPEVEHPAAHGYARPAKS
jgi:hypothetical protein